MDWYYGCENGEFFLPKDQEDLLERYSSPGCWSEWGTKAPECLNSTEEYLTKNTEETEVEFNFIDKSFKDEIEFDPYLQDKDQSCSSSVCGGLSEQFQQTALSCDRQSKYELQDLSTFEHVDDFFLDSVLEDFPCVENLHKSFLYHENQSSNTNDAVQKDVAASGFVPCNSDSKDCLDIEARAIKILDPSEQSNGDKIMPEKLSLEECTLLGFEMLVAQFTEKTRICFRDALFRLAKNTKQHAVEDLDGDLNMHQEMPHSVYNETMRSVDKKPMESETNIVDRAVANLMFNKMEINILDIPFTALVNMKREATGSKVLQEQSSKALDVTQKSHSPQPEKLPAHA
ncbi:protein LNK3 isoform X2 [Vigna radiata var. radiata]|uniref:Protein LNK3 isoform X2 n=1 Tax=Vigna radiata var. radiata TaxID=3916 RepID=A0A1S3TG01_VIGRR|nr:protein LNK3 isoform X2 [Vigna radiata var. radiata]